MSSRRIFNSSMGSVSTVHLVPTHSAFMGRKRPTPLYLNPYNGTSLSIVVVDVMPIDMSVDFRSPACFLPSFSDEKRAIHCDESKPEYNREHEQAVLSRGDY